MGERLHPPKRLRGEAGGESTESEGAVEIGLEAELNLVETHMDR